jgi:hypothetical protein
MGCGVAVYACATATQVNLSMIETCNILPATGSAGRRPIGYALFATQILGSLRGDFRSVVIESRFCQNGRQRRGFDPNCRLGGYPPARDLLACNYPQSEAMRRSCQGCHPLCAGPRDGCGDNGRRSETNIPRGWIAPGLHLPAMSLRSRTLAAGFIAPCLPTKIGEPPSGKLWIHEIKHDGFRVTARTRDCWWR